MSSNPLIIPPQQPDDLEEIEVKGAEENWSAFHLADGTTIRMRPVLLQALRSKGHYNDDGDPIYATKFGIVLDTRVPSELKKKSPTQ